jgi:hypothetical protein
MTMGILMTMSGSLIFTVRNHGSILHKKVGGIIIAHFWSSMRRRNLSAKI